MDYRILLQENDSLITNSATKKELCKDTRQIEWIITVPKADNSSNAIKESYFENIAQELSEHFGGVTIIPSLLGCYREKAGGLYCEEVVEFHVIDQCELEVDQQWNLDFVQKLISRIQVELGQESVMFRKRILSDLAILEGEKELRAKSELIKGKARRTGKEIFYSLNPIKRY